MEPQSVPAHGGREIMKRFRLLTACAAPAMMMALAAPAYAQDTRQPTSETDQQGSGNDRTRSSSPRRAARRCSPTCRSRSRRSAPRALAANRRDRHPPAQPGRAVAARLVDRLRSERLGAYPRHRHGRRQSRPRKLGRGVHRRRLSLAFGHRPQRTGRDRPDRSAARAAGHAVRPQRLGRPDQHRQQGAELRIRRRAPRRPMAITINGASSGLSPGRWAKRSRRGSTASM